MKNNLIVKMDHMPSTENISTIMDSVERCIHAHKNNRGEINRLVFESVAALTESQNIKNKLESKGFIRRMLGEITGSNQKLQNDINEQNSIVQYAAQHMLHKLAEENYLTFDLCVAINNKLNASIVSMNEEINEIYNGLHNFVNMTGNYLVNMAMQVEVLTQNVKLLKWQAAIDYQQYEGVEYKNLDVPTKIACLVKDFYTYTQGDWETSDLLLLKSCMKSLKLEPDQQINYLDTIQQIYRKPELVTYLLGADTLAIANSIDSSYLMAIEALEKFEVLDDAEQYIVEMVQEATGENLINASGKVVQEYMKNQEGIDLNMDISAYDFIMDLLYNISQYKALGKAQLDPELFAIYEERCVLRSQGIESCKDIGVDWYRQEYEKGDYRAQQALALCYFWGHNVPVNYMDAYRLFIDCANRQNMAVSQFYIGKMYHEGLGIGKDIEEALNWYKKAVNQGFLGAYTNIANIYIRGEGVPQNMDEGIRWLTRGAERGSAIAQFSLARKYEDGNGVEASLDEAIKWYKKAAEQGDEGAQRKLQEFELA